LKNCCHKNVPLAAHDVAVLGLLRLLQPDMDRDIAGVGFDHMQTMTVTAAFGTFALCDFILPKGTSADGNRGVCQDG
jgi:hypothetical protein